MGVWASERGPQETLTRSILDSVTQRVRMVRHIHLPESRDGETEDQNVRHLLFSFMPMIDPRKEHGWMQAKWSTFYTLGVAHRSCSAAADRGTLPPSLQLPSLLKQKRMDAWNPAQAKKTCLRRGTGSAPCGLLKLLNKPTVSFLASDRASFPGESKINPTHSVSPAYHQGA